MECGPLDLPALMSPGPSFLSHPHRSLVEEDLGGHWHHLDGGKLEGDGERFGCGAEGRGRRGGQRDEGEVGGGRSILSPY